MNPPPHPNPQLSLCSARGKKMGLGTTWIVTGTRLVIGREALGWHEN